MEHINYTPQKGEQVLVASDLGYFERKRVFSHVKDVEGINYFYCFDDSVNLDKPLIYSCTSWKYCKRLKGEFHIDFKPTNVLLNYNQY